VNDKVGEIRQQWVKEWNRRFGQKLYEKIILDGSSYGTPSELFS